VSDGEQILVGESHILRKYFDIIVPMLTKQETTKIIINEINPMLKELGFKKDGVSWWVLNKNEFTFKINLQVSQWGKQYYVNYGFLLNDYAEEYRWKIHFSLRLGVIYDFEYNLNALDKLKNNINDVLIPIVLKVDNIDEVRKFIEAAGPTHYNFPIKEFLGILK
jgi:P2-related tail formation protein